MIGVLNMFLREEVRGSVAMKVSWFEINEKRGRELRRGLFVWWFFSC